MEKEAKQKAKTHGVRDINGIEAIIQEMIKERKGVDRNVEIFSQIDTDGSGSLDLDEFTEAYKKINPDVSMIQLEAMFQESDIDGNGTLDLEEVRSNRKSFAMS